MDSSADNSTTPAVLNTSGTTRIVCLDGSFYGYSANSGNLMLTLVDNSTAAGSGALFQTTTTDAKAPIFADYNGRIMHIYQDEVQTYNVTRLRFATSDKIPLTSVFVYVFLHILFFVYSLIYHRSTLSPLSAITSAAQGTTANSLVAVTTSGDIYFLTACIYTADPAFAKVFAIKDNMSGDAKLESAALQMLITGGQVSSCSMITLNSSPY
jgi:hypothetical protein